MKSATHLEQVKAARKAFQAYEAAIEAAQEALKEGGLQHGLGATVMVGQCDPWGTEPRSYTCAECGKCNSAYNVMDWKFCPCCGSEILRWDKKKYEQTQLISLNVIEANPEPVPLTFQVEQASEKRKRKPE